jgi:hypothetical protein
VSRVRPDYQSIGCANAPLSSNLIPNWGPDRSLTALLDNWLARWPAPALPSDQISDQIYQTDQIKQIRYWSVGSVLFDLTAALAGPPTCLGSTLLIGPSANPKSLKD